MSWVLSWASYSVVSCVSWGLGVYCADPFNFKTNISSSAFNLIMASALMYYRVVQSCKRPLLRSTLPPAKIN